MHFYSIADCFSLIKFSLKPIILFLSFHQLTKFRVLVGVKKFIRYNYVSIRLIRNQHQHNHDERTNERTREEKKNKEKTTKWTVQTLCEWHKNTMHYTNYCWALSSRYSCSCHGHGGNKQVHTHNTLNVSTKSIFDMKRSCCPECRCTLCRYYDDSHARQMTNPVITVLMYYSLPSNH